MSKHNAITVYVQFYNGVTDTMPLRSLCGWARQHNARVKTYDGWPVINGRIKSLTAKPEYAGEVVGTSWRNEIVIAIWRYA